MSIITAAHELPHFSYTIAHGEICEIREEAGLDKDGVNIINRSVFFQERRILKDVEECLPAKRIHNAVYREERGEFVKAFGDKIIKNELKVGDEVVIILKTHANRNEKLNRIFLRYELFYLLNLSRDNDEYRPAISQREACMVSAMIKTLDCLVE